MINGTILLIGMFASLCLFVFLGYYLIELLTGTSYTWSLSTSQIRVRVAICLVGLLILGICIAFLIIRLYKGPNQVEKTDNIVETTELQMDVTESTETIETEPEKPEELLIKDELEREIDLLRHNDKEEILRWFGDSVDLMGITDSIPADLIVDEVAEDGYARILIYNEQGVKEIEDSLRIRLRSENIGISDTELDELMRQELNNYDKSNFYKVHTVKVERLNGLIVVTEHLKNVITNGEYMGRVVNYIEGEAFGEETVETSFTDEILNRGVN